MDMICGGVGELFLDFVDARNPENLRLYRTISELQNTKEKAWLVTTLSSPGSGSRKRQQGLIKSDLSIVGELAVAKEELAKLIRSSSSTRIHSTSYEGQTLLVEPIRSPCTVYIFGAGHVAQKFAMLAEFVGFRTVVLDDRSDYANSSRFPSSEIILLSSFEAPLPDLSWNEDSYLVLVTRGHLHDKTVLQQVIRKPVAYLGMIGSIMKRTILYQDLEVQGYTEQDFARIHAPIGLEIKAESPEEIAVSMVAEIILVRANRQV
jgi:xanthine dehydrogenase accessory factor